MDEEKIKCYTCGKLKNKSQMILMNAWQNLKQFECTKCRYVGVVSGIKVFVDDSIKRDTMVLKAMNQRDHEFMRLTKLTDDFLTEHQVKLGITESCMLPGFVMWLKDKGLLVFKENN